MERSFELKPEELARQLDPDILGFASTDDVAEGSCIMQQDRAMSAISFGLKIRCDGYNLYIAGPSGTGRNTVIQETIRALAAQQQQPDDICYLFNYHNNDEPRAITLPAGKGRELHEDMEELIKDLDTDIEQAFASEDYEKHKKDILNKFEKAKETLYADLEEFSKNRNFGLQATLTGLVVVPLQNGHPMREEEFDLLPDDKKEDKK
jgi:hypothetical protein